MMGAPEGEGPSGVVPVTARTAPARPMLSCFSHATSASSDGSQPSQRSHQLAAAAQRPLPVVQIPPTPPDGRKLSARERAALHTALSELEEEPVRAGGKGGTQQEGSRRSPPQKTSCQPPSLGTPQLVPAAANCAWGRPGVKVPKLRLTLLLPPAR